VTREHALQLVARDRVLNEHQGGRYTVRRDGDGYIALWQPPKGSRYMRLDRNILMDAWGVPR
jgi:hypothetical protein